MLKTKPVKIVFDVTSQDTLTQQTAIRHVTLMAESYPESFEVVIYGGALNMVVNGKSTVSKAMKKLEGNAKVSFYGLRVHNEKGWCSEIAIVTRCG